MVPGVLSSMRARVPPTAFQAVGPSRARGEPATTPLLAREGRRDGSLTRSVRTC